MSRGLKIGLVVVGAIAAVVITVLVIGGSKADEIQRKFFDVVATGDAEKLLGTMHPALREEIDPPLLAAWMKAFNTRLGAFTKKGADFKLHYSSGSNGSTVTCSGDVQFEKGTGTSKLVFLDDQLIEFNIENEAMKGDWLTGALDTTFYRQRGEQFLNSLLSTDRTAAFKLEHADFLEQVPAEKQDEMATRILGPALAVDSLALTAEKFDLQPGNEKLVLSYALQVGGRPMNAEVKFQFAGLKGWVLGFNIQPVAAADDAPPTPVEG